MGFIISAKLRSIWLPELGMRQLVQIEARVWSLPLKHVRLAPIVCNTSYIKPKLGFRLNYSRLPHFG